jgi:hypothetical protein
LTIRRDDVDTTWIDILTALLIASVAPALAGGWPPRGHASPPARAGRRTREDTVAVRAVDGSFSSWQKERTCAWCQKKSRRLVVRWERLSVCFNALLAIAIIHIWIPRLIVG